MQNTGVGDRSYYEQYYSTRDFHFYLPILASLIANSEPGSILDVGAGAGFLVEAAVRWGLSCEGIEGSAAAVEFGRKRYPGLPVRQHFLSEPFPFDSGRFQCAIMNQVIEHLEPGVARNAIHEIFRVLAPNGTVMITSPCRYNEFEARADPTHINLYTPTELRALVASAGFRDVVAMDVPMDILGRNWLGRRAVGAVFRATHWDRLSSSANCRARKPAH